MSYFRYAGAVNVTVYNVDRRNKEWIDTDRGNYDIDRNCEWENNIPSTMPAQAIIKIQQNKVTLIKFT